IVLREANPIARAARYGKNPAGGESRANPSYSDGHNKRSKPAKRTSYKSAQRTWTIQIPPCPSPAIPNDRKSTPSSPPDSPDSRTPARTSPAWPDPSLAGSVERQNKAAAEASTSSTHADMKSPAPARRFQYEASAEPGRTARRVPSEKGISPGSGKHRSPIRDGTPLNRRPRRRAKRECPSRASNPCRKSRRRCREFPPG